MIKIEHLCKSFGQRILFTDFNYEFEDGKVYALIGTSGCGKTTLLNMIGKLEPYDSGQILYQGTPLTKMSDLHFFRKELGYLFQHFGLLEYQTVEENLELGFAGQKVKREEKKSQKRQALDAVGLEGIQLSQKIYELSGGEAQRVALAKILLKNPPLILADEPTASLDPTTSLEMMEQLIRMKRKGRMIIIATHNPSIWNLAYEVVNLTSFNMEE